METEQPRGGLGYSRFKVTGVIERFFRGVLKFTILVFCFGKDDFRRYCFGG